MGKKEDKFSVTSNNVKLLKHLDELKDFQDKKSHPIMVHLMLTNQCNLRCPTCCFSATNNDGKHQELDYVIDTMEQFKKLGTKAVEFTGGGDPTLYPNINELTDHLYNIGFKIGMNTNGKLLRKVKDLNKFVWIRLSMNTLDFYDVKDSYPMDYIKSFIPGPDITGCYVWNEKGNNNLKKVIEFANKEKIPVRVVPNCIVSKEEIDSQMKQIMIELKSYENNNFVFASDHNVDTQIRRNNNCYIHHIKPAFFTDGYIYSCPSSELSVENGITLQPQFRICKGNEVYDYYTKNFDVKQRDCYYCKYKQQNELLENLLMETKHNDFA
jgi:MoaA/NifB/PqqE/SkfB family radical SAM enzyme